MSMWRLLGEFPQGRTREEIRAQTFGDWNPWKQLWSTCDEGGIVLSDGSRPSPGLYVPTYRVEHNQEVISFAVEYLESGGWRFYVPASPGEDGAFESRPPKHVGFWRNSLDENEDLPWPTPDTEWLNGLAFGDILTRAQENAQKIAYRGFSKCRLCECTNGTLSFQLGGWVWPEGFRHYIVDHQVRPSAEFVAFVERWSQENS